MCGLSTSTRECTLSSEACSISGWAGARLQCYVRTAHTTSCLRHSACILTKMQHSVPSCILEGDVGEINLNKMKGVTYACLQVSIGIDSKRSSITHLLGALLGALGSHLCVRHDV